MIEPKNDWSDLIKFLNLNSISYETNVDCRKLTPLYVGNSAPLLIKAQTLEQLHKISSELHLQGLNFIVLGRGSNTFFSSKLVSKPIINLGSEFKKIEYLGHNKFRFWAAAPFDQISRQLSLDGWSGLEFAVGIPGTAGGACKMNAGAHGAEFANIISTVGVMTDSRLNLVKPAFGYRTSSFQPQDIICFVDVILKQRDKSDIIRQIQANLNYRRHTQPLQAPSLGSVFKNTPQEYAAKLLDLAGLKGFSYGNAEFSSKHSNWIINPRKKASSDEINFLVKFARDKVKKLFSVDLELEWFVI